MAVVKLL